jgi:recombination protein RecA
LKTNPDISTKIETAIRQNSGLIAEQILAGEREADAEGEEPAEE